ncbi:MAG: DNA polymerase III subunit alpha [Oscillospiraceae bacterium]|nr:DNA polymerase III subunit alpha [Oscillospiraceae bacterium]
MTAQNNNFIHLHVHSEYSLLDGACRLENLVQQAKALGQSAIAVTDHGNLYAGLKFYQIAKQAGIKPIIGCEMYVARRTRFDRDAKFDRRSHHLVLLCENQTGYQNLIKLVSLANTEGFYEKPRIDLDLLKKYHKGLICLSGCVSGEIARLLLEHNYSGAKQKALQYQKILGAENYFLEIQNHGLQEEKNILPLLVKLSRETGVALVATNDVHYIKKSDAFIQKIMLCIQTNRTIQENHNLNFSTDEFYLKSTEEMINLFSDLPEAITNSAKIAQRCNLEIEFNHRKLPHFIQEGITDNQAYFRNLCQKGLIQHYGNSPAPEVQERLEYEMQVIADNGFVDYFLIVWDYVRYAKMQDIPVGAGRGSGAGSLCAYCLNITEIDPIANNLLFERFLNSGRKTMPDIDVDFCIEGRQKVKDYIVRRYGREHVAEIIVFDTLKAKSTIRNVGRVLNLKYELYDEIAKYMHSMLSVKEALETVPELKLLYQQDSQVKQLLDIALQIEGIPRNISVHAAGVIITQEPVINNVPVLMIKNNNMYVSQYTMDILEQLGLLKMDLLGLKNLTIIRNTEKAVRNYQKGFAIQNINFNDSAVYHFIASGNTSGMFQLESDGMRNFLMRLNPTCMEDMVAALALYRPATVDYIKIYIENKNHPEKINYLHSVLKKILASSYGCMLYQEQVMQICRDMAGYSYAQADNVRRAMSKKKQEIMKQERQVFLQGAVKNHIPEQIASQVFDQMASFASYAFNRSHATAYARIAYQTAYLKYYFFGDYMASLMTYAENNYEKLASYLEECRKQGFLIYKPDINISEWQFICQDKKIYFGLSAIKGLSRMLIDKLTQERRKNGKFISFVDFCKRTQSFSMGKLHFEVLIKSGALDDLDCNRKQMLLYYKQVLESLNSNNRDITDGQMSFFEEVNINNSHELPEIADFSNSEKLQLEKEVFGFYLTGHPVNQLQYLQELFKCYKISELENLQESAHVRVLALIQSCKEYKTKKNQTMCFLTMEDSSGIIESVIFPNAYLKAKNRLQTGKLVYLTGKISKKNYHVNIICEHVRQQEELFAMTEYMQLCIKISPEEKYLLQKISEICEKFSGKTEVIFYLTETGKYILPKKKISVAVTENFYQALCEIISPEKIGCIPTVIRQK